MHLCRCVPHFSYPIEILFSLDVSYRPKLPVMPRTQPIQRLRGIFWRPSSIPSLWISSMPFRQVASFTSSWNASVVWELPLINGKGIRPWLLHCLRSVQLFFPPGFLGRKWGGIGQAVLGQTYCVSCLCRRGAVHAAGARRHFPGGHSLVSETPTSPEFGLTGLE